MAKWQCPQCGAAASEEIAPNKRRCEYCGTVWSPPAPPAPPVPPAPPPATVMVLCPTCGAENDRQAVHCAQCGARLRPTTIKADPATLSIIVSVAGAFFFPLVGPILGLVLGYRARNMARAGAPGASDENRARTAIIVGWAMLVLSLLPICIGLIAQGVAVLAPLCATLPISRLIP